MSKLIVAIDIPDYNKLEMTRVLNNNLDIWFEETDNMACLSVDKNFLKSSVKNKDEKYLFEFIGIMD